jgi:DNA polymerase sigma
MTTGELWIEFLRYYTERFDYKNNIVTIRQIEPLRRDEKGWFNPTIAIEDPFILTHNLADRLSLKSINFQKLLSYLKILF